MRARFSPYLRLLNWLVPAIVVAAVWAPILTHYRIPRPSLSPELIDRARSSPADTVLAELEGVRYSGRRWSEVPDLIPIAERLLKGEAAIPGFPTTKVHLPFDADELERGLPGWQLLQGSLVVPDILLAAYDATGRDQFLFTARDVILGWAAYERRAVLPNGFLWNDHALATRVAVLGHFWHVYRRHPAYDSTVARSVLEFAMRGGLFLAAPGHFTFATNHGVMQNLGLWHLTVAFPWVPGCDSLRQVAFDRLDGQLRYYLDSEGVFLEHSAGYQAFGLELMGMALRYLTLAGRPIPSEWSRKYEAAKAAYDLMARPDGSLPPVGDTDIGPQPFIPRLTTVDASGRAAPLRNGYAWNPEAGSRLFANAGYAVWWDGRGDGDRATTAERRVETNGGLRQTFVTWSYFPGHGHKHADELSTLLWADGQSWWTNVGYWNYGYSNRAEAESWPGSNAPHRMGEPANSLRETRLVGAGGTPRISVLDLERRGPGSYRARRLVLHVRPDQWLIVDQTDGDAGDSTTTTWTTAPDVALVAGPASGTYKLTAVGTRLELRTAVATSDGSAVRLRRGSDRPFAGWTVRNTIPTPATSIVVDQPARQSWSSVVWRLARPDAAPSRVDSTGEEAIRIRFRSSEEWEATLSPWLGGGSIRREGEIISVRDAPGGKETQTIRLAPVPRDSVEAQSIERGLLRMASAYPKFRDYMPERLRITRWLAVGFLAQELFFLVLWRRRAKVEPVLRAFALALWLVGGIWVVALYLNP
jgi:heparinase II/III-like protein